MGTFVRKPAAKITAKYADSDNTVTIAGVTSAANVTGENATTQINRLFGIAGKQVVKSGMIRTVTEEVSDDE